MLHLAGSLHGRRELVFDAASCEGADATGGGAWLHRQVAFSCQRYLLQPESCRVSLPRGHVLSQSCGEADARRSCALVPS